MKKFGRWFAIVFLAVTGMFGIANGVNEFGAAETALQMSVQVGDALWGILGILTAIGMWRRRPWTLTTSVSWALSLTYTGTVASFAFHDASFAEPSTKAGTIAAFASLAAISALIVWAVRVASRPIEAPKSTPV